MGIFDTSSMSSEASKSLVSDALTMALYAYHNLDDGLSTAYQKYGFNLGLPVTLFTALFGDGDSQGIIPGIPWNPDAEIKANQSINNAGWFVIGADKLDYAGKTDSRGTFYGENEGYKTAQAEILGKYDENGKLVQIGIAFRGTTGPRETLIPDLAGDIINDLGTALNPAEYSENYALNAFGDLLQKVSEYATKYGLKGSDILVSGHSLGGVAVNSLAALSDNNFGGFYSDSKYVAFASMTQYEKGNKVLNVGFENDPVFRVLDGTDATLSSLVVHDKNYASTTDNIVNFNDYYASDIWNLLPQSVANLPAWLTHMPFAYQNTIPRILNSEFYSLTERDSTIVVSNLSDATRGSTWVQDLNRYADKHTGPTFVLGSDYADLIRGSEGTSYLEGGKGNDKFQTGGGHNIVLGGEGTDTLDLQASLSDYKIAWDGETLYLKDKDNAFTLAKGIEKIQCTEKFLWIFNQQKTLKVSDEGLRDNNKLYSYTKSVKGDAADNTLTADKGDWMFGHDGNDTLIGSGNNTFVGGKGDDFIIGKGANNTYLFSGDFSHDKIYNFNSTDKLVFVGVPGRISGNYRDYITQDQNDLVLNFGENSVTLVGVHPDALTSSQVVIA